MGNGIKNYERKKRRERKQAYKEIRQIAHDVIAKRMDFMEQECELFFNVVNKTEF